MIINKFVNKLVKMFKKYCHNVLLRSWKNPNVGNCNKCDKCDKQISWFCEKVSMSETFIKSEKGMSIQEERLIKEIILGLSVDELIMYEKKLNKLVGK